MLILLATASVVGALSALLLVMSLGTAGSVGASARCEVGREDEPLGALRGRLGRGPAAAGERLRRRDADALQLGRVRARARVEPRCAPSVLSGR